MAKVVVWSSEALCRVVEYDCPTIHDTTTISDCAMSFVPCLARVARACTDELNVPYPGILLRLVVYGISWTSRRRRRDPSSQIPSHSADKVCHCVSVQISQIFLSPVHPGPPHPPPPRSTLPHQPCHPAPAGAQCRHCFKTVFWDCFVPGWPHQRRSPVEIGRDPRILRDCWRRQGKAAHVHPGTLIVHAVCVCEATGPTAAACNQTRVLC